MSSCAINKGFKSLKVYNYFDAKQKFERVEKRKIVPSSYGLSVIYQRKDNPFYNLDSALIKIVSAVNNYSSLSQNQKEKYSKIGIDSLIIVKQRDLISNLYYKRALETNSIYGFQDFINKNNWSKDIRQAKRLRDSLFFFENHEKGRALDYELFLTTYPNSIYSNRASKLYNKAFFIENTKNNSIADYKQYLIDKPNGDFVIEAQNSIFKLATQHKTIKEYQAFITTYPKNRNIKTAWGFLYDTYMQKSYTLKNIELFLVDYPNYPFKHSISNELFMANIKFYKYKAHNKWGFISEGGKYYIEPKFDFVEDFHEGLAVVSLNNKLGFITKTDDVKIKTQFDDAFSFQNGFAVVEVNELFGLINRSGEYVLEPIYDDLGNVNNGLLYAERNEKIGYFNTRGEEVIFHQYTDGSNFKNKLAIVEKNDKAGVIDENGNTKIEIKYQQIKMLNSHLFAVQQNENWGIINIKGETILSIEYDFIGNTKSNLILIEKNNQFKYWNKLTTQFLPTIWFENYSEFKILANFKDGFAKVKTNEGYIFINTKGQFVFNETFKKLGVYNTFVAFEDKDTWGYIDKQGKVIIKPNYTKSYSFFGVGGVVEIDDLKGLIDESGEILIPVFYEELKLLNDSILIVKKGNSYGLLTLSNDTIIPIKYNLIEPISNSIVKIVSDNELTYFNFITRSWLKKEE